MASEVEGIDEIVETPSAVQLVFHVRRDWLAEADEAAQEIAWKSDRCVRFMRSPEFKERFGMKPGTLLLKAARQPPADVLGDMARLGADVEVGTIGFVGQGAQATVTCAVCNRGGFANSQMSMTERGLTCNACFSTWLVQHGHGTTEADRIASGNNGRIVRAVLGIILFSLLAALRHCH